MIIKIENPHSPGASFTDNTNEVILKVSDWIDENPASITFKNLRKSLQNDKGINDNNNRNIFPLLKNCGFVEYGTRTLLEPGSFFTKRGKAYVRILRSQRLLEEDDSIENSKTIHKKLKDTLSEIILMGLVDLAKSDSNYANFFVELLNYIKAYHKIDKNEFAYLVYSMNTDIDPKTFKKVISDYRNNNISIEVSVVVRNDLKVREAMQSSNRKEGINFLSSYTYLVGLANQAGIVTKDGSWYVLETDGISKINMIVGENNGR